ncbi:MAG: GHKL domain-containing protein, partial [Flavisolibacter sp.]|nr:GHKL domain-containing protein [Flavisolibacter sp.]
ASLLEKESAPVLSEQSKMFVEKIVHSSTRMQKLIDDILRFSSLKAMEGDFVPVDLSAVLDQVRSDLEVAIEENRARIEAEELPVIEAIPSQLGQLFQNLISNAIKFRKEEESPFIKIFCTEVTGEQLLQDNRFPSAANIRAMYLNWQQKRFLKISVEDNGIGFDKAYEEKVFEIFQRLNSIKKQEGTGIGLAICKKIVDNHHGFIKAESETNKGTTFIIVLPVLQTDGL